jgi:hypothetical protein
MTATATLPIHLANGDVDWHRPDFSDVSIKDFADALSRIFRWRGCIPVTVAQHSVAMVNASSTDDVARWCLLHDAHEMCTADIPSPLKDLGHMRGYVRAEERFERAVADRFDLSLPRPAEVKRLDLRARRSEVDEFLPHARASVRYLRPLPEPLAPAWSVARSRREYVSTARRLGLS